MPATPYTLGSLTAELQDWAEDIDGQHYTADLIRGWINDAMVEWLLRTQLLRHTWTMALNQNQSLYDLPGLEPLPIDVQSVAVPTSAGSSKLQAIPLVTQEWLEANYPDWRNEPPSWPRRFARFTTGHKGIFLHPPPASSQANALQVIGMASSVDMTSPSDSIVDSGIDVQYQHAIKTRVKAFMCAEDVPIAQPSKGPGYLAQFEADVMKAQRLAKSNFQSKPAQVARGSYC